MIVGTMEYKYENIEPVEPEVQDYTEEIETMNKELEELQYDESIPLEYDLQIHFKSECERYEVDVKEAVAIMLTENPTLNAELVHKNENGTKDTGLLQINSCHKKEFENMGFDNLKDPKQNISYGIYFLSTLDKYKGHEKYIAYNCGEGGMKEMASRGITSTEYSRNVMAKLRGSKGK